MNIKERAKKNKLSIFLFFVAVFLVIIASVQWYANKWGGVFKGFFIITIVFVGIICLWRFLLLVAVWGKEILKKNEDKCEKSNLEIADDLCDRVFNLESDDKKKLYERLSLGSSRGVEEKKNEEKKNEEKKNEEKKEIDRRSQKYWMYIWRIVYNIQECYPEKGYLEYADNNLSKQYQSFWGTFSDNNYVTFISLVLGILSIVGQENADMPLIVLIEMVAIVAFENLKSYLQKDEPERAENERCRKIIEGVLNASKK